MSIFRRNENSTIQMNIFALFTNEQFNSFIFNYTKMLTI